MKKILTLALSALLAATLAGPAAAGPTRDDIPRNSCEVQRLLGVENVKECEPVE